LFALIIITITALSSLELAAEKISLIPQDATCKNLGRICTKETQVSDFSPQQTACDLPDKHEDY
jgi:hypothetical protein